MVVSQQDKDFLGKLLDECQLYELLCLAFEFQALDDLVEVDLEILVDHLDTRQLQLLLLFLVKLGQAGQ